MSYLTADRRSQLYFLTGQLVSGMGDELYTLSIAIRVFNLTKSPLLLAVTFAVAYGGATVGYLLVPLLNRLPNIRVMIMTDLISALAVLLIWVVPAGWIWALQFLLGLLRSVGRPFAYALIPDLCADDATLTRLNADFQTAGTVSTVFGFVTSGLFTASHLLSWAFPFDAASFLVCALLTWRIGAHATVMAKRERAERDYGSYGRRLLQIAGPLRRDAVLSSLLLPTSLMFGVSIAFHNQLVALVNVAAGQPIYYVLTEMVMALGIIAAAQWLRRHGALPRGEGAQVRLWLGATACMGVAYGLASLTGTWGKMVSLLFLSAACDGTAGILQMNLLHRRVPEAHREQLLSFRFLARNLSKAVVTPLAGLSVQTWGVSGTLAGLGFAIALMAAGTYAYLARQIGEDAWHVQDGRPVGVPAESLPD